MRPVPNRHGRPLATAQAGRFARLREQLGCKDPPILSPRTDSRRKGRFPRCSALILSIGSFGLILPGSSCPQSPTAIGMSRPRRASGGTRREPARCSQTEPDRKNADGLARRFVSACGPTTRRVSHERPAGAIELRREAGELARGRGRGEVAGGEDDDDEGHAAALLSLCLRASFARHRAHFARPGRASSQHPPSVQICCARLRAAWRAWRVTARASLSSSRTRVCPTGPPRSDRADARGPPARACPCAPDCPQARGRPPRP
jgi:hypothetical protein